MLNYILTEENLFNAFNREHQLVWIIAIASCVLLVWIANRFLSERQQTLLGTIIALTTTFFVLFRMSVQVYAGIFDIQTDLPLFLCRLLPFFTPLMMWKRHQPSFGILYFWVLAGTSNALITPDLAYGLPNYDAMTYWVMHFGLVITIFYGVFVYKIRPYARDFKRAIIAGVLYIVVTHLINMGLNANYAFTMRKPPQGSIMDVMGPWPIYLFTVFLLGLVLFCVAYFPFYIKDRKARNRV